MKFYSILMAACLAFSSVAITGCDLADKGVAKYDTLVDKDEACTAAWSDYESNLQRRADMIPQLVSVVKGSAAHESETLKAVIQARADATSVRLNPAAGDFEDAKKFAEYQAKQQRVHTTFQQLQEQYPQLQANAAFHDLQVQIEGTENRLLRSRQQYNKAVLAFNTELRHVSGKVINPVTGHEFKPRAYFSADETAKVAPKIDFESKPTPAPSK